MAGEIDLEKFVTYWKALGLNLGARRYRQIADEDRVPKVIKNKIADPMAAMTKIAVYYQSLAEDRGNLSLNDERTRLTRINADQKQLNLEKARGELIDTAFAQKMWGGVLENIVKKIDIIPSKLPPLAYGLTIPEIKDIAERMIFEVKNEISNPDLESIARNFGNKRVTKHSKAPRNPVSKRVGRPKSDAKPRSKRGAGKVVHEQG